MSLLFEPLELRGVRLRNRIGISPMCQYSATDGIPDDWHLVHLASRAVGGAGLVITEATAVTPEGRITPGCTGIYNDHQATSWARIVAAIAGQGAVPGIQLAHAGRKASTTPPWETGSTWLGAADGGWQVVGPSPLPFEDGAHVPHELDEAEIAAIVTSFANAARRAVDVGFELVEVHAAHGYLLHSFLTPLANERTDRYGSDREGRMRLVLEVTAAVREAVGEQVPVLVRISASDWAPGGWAIEDSVVLAERLREVGADMIDCSSGGAVPHAKIELGPGYQVPFAAQIRAEANIPTAAVGMITSPEQAEDVLVDGAADLVLIARESLRDPYFPLHAAAELDAMDVVEVPLQYARGLSRRRGGAPLD